MLWFEYYFNLLFFLFLILFWCVELTLPLHCKREMERKSYLKALKYFPKVPLKPNNLTNSKVFCNVNNEFQQSNCNF